ncbi:hypothetical protein BO94DRAFT_548810 [Aspergillus sclerotioniger CBS 115572]|uniref:Transcription factor domain-containing protein n=1 Tax=Aspergillus sclerotioniger CBS 115572 TaxID=1450535 RepID=A0A317VYK6_9EURO|nr:hypothetical protein BO94DRAFT_548810 [Aspergillus sclerotioniger CBS 115572]PWY78008.1 hypothetical protein BO94DRAFT_548810 [Aspergillus sclerotioniger CBS 115572]
MEQRHIPIISYSDGREVLSRVAFVGPTSCAVIGGNRVPIVDYAKDRGSTEGKSAIPSSNSIIDFSSRDISHAFTRIQALENAVFRHAASGSSSTAQPNSSSNLPEVYYSSYFVSHGLHMNFGVLHVPSTRIVVEESYRQMSQGETPIDATLLLLLSIFANATFVWTPYLYPSNTDDEFITPTGVIYDFPRSVPTAMSASIARIQLAELTHTRLCWLHRRFHLESAVQDRYAYSREAGLRSVRMVLSVRQLMEDTGPLISVNPCRLWSVMEHVFCAAIMLASDVSLYPTAPDATTRQDEVWAACRLLEQLTPHVNGIQQMLQTLRATLQGRRSRQEVVTEVPFSVPSPQPPATDVSHSVTEADEQMSWNQL